MSRLRLAGLVAFTVCAAPALAGGLQPPLAPTATPSLAFAEAACPAIGPAMALLADQGLALRAVTTDGRDVRLEAEGPEGLEVTVLPCRTEAPRRTAALDFSGHDHHDAVAPVASGVAGDGGSEEELVAGGVDAPGENYGSWDGSDVMGEPPMVARGEAP